MRVIAPHIRQHQAKYNAWRPGHITDVAFVETYLRQTTDVAGLELVPATLTAPNPVVSLAHKFGLGGWAHITTSCIDFMGWHETGSPYAPGPGAWEFVSVGWFTCGDGPDWDDLVAHADEFFGVVDPADPRQRSWSLILPELARDHLL